MAKNKNKTEEAKETVKKEQVEARIENDITKLPEKGNGSSNKGVSNGGNNGGKKKPTTVMPTSGSNTLDRVTKSANESIAEKLQDFRNELNENQKVIDTKNKDEAARRGIDDKGDSQYYLSLKTLRDEKNQAEEELDEAIKNNKTISENKSLKDTYQKALNANKNVQKEIKKQDKAFGKRLKGLEKEKAKLEKDYKGKSAEELEMSLKEANEEIAGSQYALQEFQKSKEWTDNVGDPTLQKKMKDLAEQQAQATQKRDELLSQFRTAEEFEANIGKINDQIYELKDQQLMLTSDGINNFLEWAEQSGTDDDKAKAKILRSLQDDILKADEDGTITDEEKENILQLMQGCEDAIKNEKNSDPTVVAAQKKYDSARNKYMYYLFDQIKSIAVLLVGLSTGSAQMIYSALDNFNKQIADEEAAFKTDTIRAFSNNNVKGITGQSDSQYIMETQVLPELKKNQIFKQMSSEDQALVVEQFEKAFKEYKRFMDNEGGLDFAAWFNRQTAKGNDWASIINSLIEFGALNQDSLNSLFDSFIKGSSNGGNANNGNKKTSMLNLPGKTNSIIQNVLSSTAEQEVADAQENVDRLRSMQSDVVNALAQRTQPKGPIPQGKPVETPKGWGSYNYMG